MYQLDRNTGDVTDLTTGSTVDLMPPMPVARTHADMVRYMTRANFTPERLEEERDRLMEAIEHMRKADVTRVMHFTDLRSPFARRNRAG